MPRKPRSHVRILMYQAWPINISFQDLNLVFNLDLVQVNLFLKATSNAHHCWLQVQGTCYHQYRYYAILMLGCETRDIILKS